MIDWAHVKAPPGIEDHLVATLDPTVTVRMRVDADGDYVISFAMAIHGKHRTLPEVEGFIRRASMLLDELEV